MSNRESVGIRSTNSKTIRPHNSLPAEILIPIFISVCSSYQCPLSALATKSENPGSLNNSSIRLSHVCSYWRHVAINTSELWTHIDLALEEFPPTRAETFLTRAGGNLLDIHVNNRFNKRSTELLDEESHFRPWAEFLANIAPRTWALTVQAPDRPGSRRRLCRRVIPTFVKNCVPGRLKLLHVEMHSTSGHDPQETLTIGKPSVVETLWHPVQVLRVYDFQPRWTSKLYHGLTELRLVNSWWVPESELAAVLMSSPKLRILHIDTEIIVDRRIISGIPVLFQDLEVLVIGPGVELDNILKLVQPGPKALALTIPGASFEEHPYFLSKDKLKSFFARSNVTRLIVTQLSNYRRVADILTIAPHIQSLALEDVRFGWIEDESILPQPVPIDTLYVTRSPYLGGSTWPCIDRIAQRHRVRELVLWQDQFGPQGQPDNLYIVCPLVTLVPSDDPDPIQDWK